MKRRLYNLSAQIAPPLSFFALFVLSWHAVVEFFAIPPYLLPGPPRVGHAIAANATRLIDATQLTALGALSGFALSLVMGFAVALLFSQSRFIQRGLYPYAIFLQTVPVVAIGRVPKAGSTTGIENARAVAAVSRKPLAWGITLPRHPSPLPRSSRPGLRLAAKS